MQEKADHMSTALDPSLYLAGMGNKMLDKNTQLENKLKGLINNFS